MKFLKLIIYMLVVLSACVGFVSCSNDDEPVNDVNSVIIGKWDSDFLGAMTYEEVEKLDLSDRSIVKHYDYFTFNSDGTGYIIYDDGHRADWSWEIIDGTIYCSNGFVYEIVKFNKDVVYLLRHTYYYAGLKLVRM